MEPKMRSAAERILQGEPFKVVMPCKCDKTVAFGLFGLPRRSHECLICGASVVVEHPDSAVLPPVTIATLTLPDGTPVRAR